MANEKLINYIVEIELVNQTLSNERNKREQKREGFGQIKKKI